MNTDPYYEAENPSQAGRNFSTDRKVFVILHVFVSSWWIGSGLYHEDAKTQRIAKFLVAAQLLCVHRWFHFVAFMPLRIARELEFSPEAWGSVKCLLARVK